MDGIGDEWTAVAGEWSDFWAPVARPAQEAIMAAAGVGPGSRVLDVGCGSGEFLALLGSAGAVVAGCDLASGMVELAQDRNPGADIRSADAEHLPWPDDSFELVTAINALQFADDSAAALSEFARVGRRVAIANWAEDARNDLTAMERAMAGDDYEPSGDSREEGYLTALLSEAGFTVELESIVETPMLLRDAPALVTALTFGEDEPARAELAPLVLRAAEPFRQPDGSYLLLNHFRFAVARR